MAPDRSLPRTQALDGLRALAAAGILVLHVWMFDHGDAGDPPKTALDLVLGELRLGVPLFFVLSGLLVYRPFVAAALDGRPRPRLGRYALRRAARILPAYWAALAGSFLLLNAIDHPLAAPAAQLPRFLLFAQNQSEATIKHLDPPMWTLAVEVSFYVVLPLVAIATARLGRRRGAQVLLCAALVACGAALTAASHVGAWPATVTTSLLLNLSAFGAGMLVAALGHARRLPRRAGLALAGAGAALVAGDGAWHALALGPYAARAIVADLPAVLGFACLVGALTAAPLRARLLACRPLAVLGTLSYGVYLWHFPVIHALRAAGHWPAHLGRALAAVSAITLALAVVSWLALERPVLRWARRRTATARRTRAPSKRRPASRAALPAET